MNVFLKPLLATLTLAAIAYGSQAQTRPEAAELPVARPTPAIAAPVAARAVTPEADAGSVAEPNTVALILAALGVVGLVSRRRFGG